MILAPLILALSLSPCMHVETFTRAELDAGARGIRWNTVEMLIGGRWIAASSLVCIDGTCAARWDMPGDLCGRSKAVRIRVAQRGSVTRLLPVK